MKTSESEDRLWGVGVPVGDDFDVNANTFPSRAEAERFLEFINGKYPREGRCVVSRPVPPQPRWERARK